MKAESKQEEVEEADCGGTRTQNAIPCVTTMTGGRGGMVHGTLLIQGYKALPVGSPLDPDPASSRLAVLDIALSLDFSFSSRWPPHCWRRSLFQRVHDLSYRRRLIQYRSIRRN